MFRHFLSFPGLLLGFLTVLFVSIGAPGALADCTSPAGLEGAIYYNSNTSVYEYCNGTSWIDMTNAFDLTATATDLYAPLQSPNDIFVDGNYAYMTSGQSDTFAVLDITDKSNPTIISTLVLDGVGVLWVSGDYAYITQSTNDALLIVDVSNKLNPSIVGSISDILLDQKRGIEVVGNYAYLTGNDDRLTIVDVTDKTNPSIIGSVYNFLYIGDGLTVDGDYVYAVTNWRISSIDISDKANPTVLHNYQHTDGLGNAKEVKVVGNYAFVVNFNGLTSIDISDPNNLVIGHDSDDSSSFVSACYDLDIFGNYAYITCYNSSNIAVYDISDPINLSSAGQFSDPSFFRPTDIKTDGDYLYTANLSNSIAIMDINPPVVPTSVTGLLEEGNAMDGVRDVAVSGNYVYGAAYSANTLAVLDNTDTVNLSFLSEVGSSSQGQSGPWGIDVAGDYAYLASRWSDSLTIVDVSTPSAPVITGTYAHSTYLDGAKDVVVSGNYAYLVHNDVSGYFTVIDVTNKSAPTLAETYNSSAQYANHFTVDGNYAYLPGNNVDHLEIVDISTPTNVFQAGIITDNTWLDGARSVAISGNYAFVTARVCDCVTTVDISNKASPSIVGYVQDSVLLNGVEDIVISGIYAFVTVTPEDRITVIDISTPTAPVIVKSYSDPNVLAAPYGIDTDDSYIYVADASKNTIVVLDISNVLGTSSGPCSTEGYMRYNATNNVMEFCDGSDWKDTAPTPGTGGAGCSSPTGMESAMRYDSASKFYKYCDGANWVNVD